VRGFLGEIFRKTSKKLFDHFFDANAEATRGRLGRGHLTSSFVFLLGFEIEVCASLKSAMA
jgi:hypothetical protein